MALPGTIDEIVRESVQLARRKGYKIQRGDWGVRYRHGTGWVSDTKCICPLGAVLLHHQPPPDHYWEDVYLYEGALEELLGVSASWLDDFTEGVDKGPKGNAGSEAGHRLACELIDGKPV